MKNVDPSALVSALEQSKPTKKMWVVRSLMPKIREAKQRGLSMTEIWESLKKAGLDMSYANFMTYLYRIEAKNQTKKGDSSPPLQSTPLKPISEALPILDHTIQKMSGNIEGNDNAPQHHEDKSNQIVSTAGAALVEIKEKMANIDYRKIARQAEIDAKK